MQEQPIPATEPVPVNSLAVIRAKFKLELIKNGFRAIQDKADSLVINENTIEVVQKFLKDGRAMTTVIKALHKRLKEPSLTEGRMYDDAQNYFLEELGKILNPKEADLNKFCREKKEREDALAKEQKRKDDILAGIEANVLNFSSKIAACKTVEGLIEIERAINLEKGQKKYGEYVTISIERLNTLNQIVAAQKKNVRELEALAKQEEEAAGDQEVLYEIMEKKEDLQIAIEEKQIVAQETAIGFSTNRGGGGYVQVFSTVKARLTTWKAEIADDKEAAKKDFEMLDISLNAEKVRERIKTLTSEKVLHDKIEEYTVNGIRYYKVTKY